MKILYGVCGEGFGHSSRAKEIIIHLKNKGHEVLVITYGQAYGVLKQFPIIKTEGVSLAFERGELSLLETIKTNLPRLATDIKNWPKIKRKIDAFRPDVCITDMEVTVPIISYWYKLPLISIDNQHRLTHFNLAIPKRYKKDFLMAKTAINTCVSKADTFIILTFAKQSLKSKNAYPVSPVLRKEVITLKGSVRDHILVYQTKKDPALISVLKNIPEKFVVYGYEKENREGNVQFKKFGKHFLLDLASCKAVIGTAGFTLMSEALYLKKPYYALPLQGQFEQTLNALFLKKSGFGEYAEEIDLKKINQFIKQLQKYRKKLDKYSYNSQEAIDTLDRRLSNLTHKL